MAAVRTGRHYLGYDTDDAYVKAARERVAAEVAAASPRPDKATEAARHLLVEAGFAVADAKRRRFAGGLTVDWVATDSTGAEWAVLVAGASTVARTGLRRSDVLLRTLGEAAVLTNSGVRVLVVTTDLPAPRSAPLAAVRAARGRTLVDVLEIGVDGAAERLAHYASGVTEPVGDLLAGG